MWKLTNIFGARTWRRIRRGHHSYNGHGSKRSAIESIAATCQRAHSRTLRRWLWKVEAGKLGESWRKPIVGTLMLRGEV